MTKKHKRLTIEQLRSFPGLENLTDEEAERDIKSLETLSILLFELYHKDLRAKAQQAEVSDAGA